MKPEEEAEIIIWDWLINKGTNIKEIYFNRKNKVNAKVFSTKGLNEKPDLIIKVDNGFGEEYVAVEVKPCKKSIDVLKAHKIIKYFENYVSGMTKYFIDNKEININIFVIATENSMKGYLFKKEELKDNLKSTNESKVNVASNGIIPRYEGNRTHDLVRILWNFYGDVRNNYDKKIGLGILIANVECNYMPHLMITSHYNNRWGQRFWNI